MRRKNDRSEKKKASKWEPLYPSPTPLVEEGKSKSAAIIAKKAIDAGEASQPFEDDAKRYYNKDV